MIDRKKITVFILFLLTVSGSVLFWSSMQQLLHSPYTQGETLHFSITPLLLFILSYIGFILPLTLDGLLITDRRLRYLFYLILIGGVGFVLEDNLVRTLGILLLTGVVLFYDTILQRDITLHIRPHLLHLMGPRLPLLTTSISIILATGFFLTGTANISNISLELPTQLFDQALTVVEPLVLDQIENQKEQFLNNGIASLEEQLPVISELTQEQKEQLVKGTVTPAMRDTFKESGYTDDQINQLQTQLQQQYSQFEEEFDTRSEETANTLLQQVRVEVEDGINQIINTNKELVPWGLSFAIFIIFSSLGLIINAISLLITTLVVQLFKRANLIKEHTEMKEVTTLVINETPEKTS